MHYIQHGIDRKGTSPSAPRGCKPQLRTRKNRSDSNLEDRMKWLVIDIPCCSTTGSRKSSEPPLEIDVFRDKDFIIDKRGLRRISPSILPRRPEKDLQLQTFLLERDSLVHMDDDCVSVASTIGDESGRSGPQSPAARLRPSNLQWLEKREQIGKGSCGIVWRVVNTEEGSGMKSFAVKELNCATAIDEEKKRILIEELRLAYRVDHVCVVPTVEVFYSSGVFSLVMEFMDGGSLLDALKCSVAAGRGGLSCAALAHIGRSVAEALAYLHEDLRVLHRDIKPSNILLSSSAAVKVGDLGICSSPNSGESPAESTESLSGGLPASQWIGTVTYMSPERILGDRYSFNADVWSLGVVLAEACLCRYPYAPSSGQLQTQSADRSFQFWDLLDSVLTGPCPSDAVREHLAMESCDHEVAACFVKQCLARDLRDRPNARECLAHPFLHPSRVVAGRAALRDWLSTKSYSDCVEPSTVVAESDKPLSRSASSLLLTRIPSAGGEAGSRRSVSPQPTIAAARAGAENLLGRLEELFMAFSTGGGSGVGGVLMSGVSCGNTGTG